MSNEEQNTNVTEETIYNPYNDNNKEITHNIIKKILNSYDVFYNINDIDIFKKEHLFINHM